MMLDGVMPIGNLGWVLADWDLCELVHQPVKAKAKIAAPGGEAGRGWYIIKFDVFEGEFGK